MILFLLIAAPAHAGDSEADEEKDTWFIRKNRLCAVKRGVSALRSTAAAFVGASVLASDTEDEDDDDMEPLAVVCYEIGYATE